MAPLLPTAVRKGLVFKAPLSESVKQQDSGMEANHYARVITNFNTHRERERERERESDRDRERDRERERISCIT